MHLHSRLFQWAFLLCSRSFFQPVPLPSKLEASEDSFTPSSCAEAVYPESFGGVSYSTQNVMHVNVVYSTSVCTVHVCVQYICVYSTCGVQYICVYSTCVCTVHMCVQYMCTSVSVGPDM